MKPPPLLPLVLLFTFGLGLMAVPARADTPDPVQRAHELEAKAHEAAVSGRHAEAASALRAAWALAPVASVACNLGTVEHARRRFAEAAEFLSHCIESAPPARTPQEKKRLAVHIERLAQARAEVVALLVHLSEPLADVLLDGQSVSPLPRVLFVEPGHHRITATLEGFEAALAEVDGRAGETLEINLALRPIPEKPTIEIPKPAPAKPLAPPIAIPANPNLAPARPEPPPPRATSGKKVAASILGGGAGVSIAIGVAFSAFLPVTGDAKEQATSAFKRDVGPCGSPCGAWDAGTVHSATQTLAVSGFAVGGALLTLAGLVGLWPQPAAPQTARALSTVAVW